jgi:uridine kinase
MPDILSSPAQFSATLFEVMKRINPAIADLELYEFRYCLDNLIPESGNWASITLDTMEAIEQRVNDISFYRAIQIKPRLGERIVLDPAIARLTDMLFTGLVTGVYPEAWVREHFYFDIRSFFFFHRTVYFTPSVLAHLGGQPVRRFEAKQVYFERLQDVGYQAFKAANAELDQCFTETVQKLISLGGTPTLLAIAGPTAAGKTEIVARLRSTFEAVGHTVSAIELDNFLTDREPREAKGIFTQGKEALHYELLKQSLAAICQGQKITIPRYDFYYATSSHDEQGNLKPGGVPIEIEPADIVFMEGNFPFLLSEIAQYIRIKVVYLTQDDIRLKRKWKRDIDYRKKYEPTYFRNRFFKDQFIMAQFAYIPQMEICDLVVDTTGGALWATSEIGNALKDYLQRNSK